MKKAPVTIVFVADKERSKNARPTGVFVDAGTMGEACYLAATSLGLAGCVRASFDHDALRDGMNLPPISNRSFSLRSDAPRKSAENRNLSVPSPGENVDAGVSRTGDSGVFSLPNLLPSKIFRRNDFFFPLFSPCATTLSRKDKGLAP